MIPLAARERRALIVENLDLSPQCSEQLTSVIESVEEYSRRLLHSPKTANGHCGVHDGVVSVCYRWTGTRSGAVNCELEVKVRAILHITREIFDAFIEDLAGVLADEVGASLEVAPENIRTGARTFTATAHFTLPPEDPR